ncbi:MAG TPA: YceI family protein, partial [Cyclobacteriaceae bacterium]|nr:YceI family protein [Cyclobacteriaceae bacterium]
ITFFSDALLEDITATNTKTTSLFNPQSGDIAFSVPIREFQFEKKLMQEHFNEKYMESDKYPNATFSGKLVGFDPAAQSEQAVKAKGKLTLHGVTKDVELPGTVRAGEKIAMKSKFRVKLADYNIKIPQLVFQNIAEEVEVSVAITYKHQ